MDNKNREGGIMQHNKIKLLNAIDILIRHYSKFKPDEMPTMWIEEDSLGHHCPLCIYGGEIGGINGVGMCRACPWIMFEGRSCNALWFYGHTTKERLDRLERWKNEVKTL